VTLCRHCRARPVCRPWRLCHPCYDRPRVRRRYIVHRPYRYSGIPDRNGPVPPPQEPTTARPGSVEKLAVLVARAKQGAALWHPGDAEQE
jgi:hypothetical protein